MADESQAAKGLWKRFVEAYLMNPIVAIATSILIAIFVLLASAIFGWDKGQVLATMAQTGYARGLITYLFSVVTIGTAVVLVVFALTFKYDGDLPRQSTDAEKAKEEREAKEAAYEKRFQHGKEILALLLGVFGAIVGFYFGSETSARTRAEEAGIKLSPIHLSAQTVVSGGAITVQTYVVSGKSPVKYGVGFDTDQIQITENVDPTGWIIKTINAPTTNEQKPVIVRLIVQDSSGNKVESSVPVIVRPSQ